MSEKRPWRPLSAASLPQANPVPGTVMAVELWSPNRPRSSPAGHIWVTDAGKVMVGTAGVDYGMLLERSDYTHWRTLLTEPPEHL